MSLTRSSFEHLGEPQAFEQIFEAGPDGMLVSDVEGRIMRVNPQIEAMFGYGRDELAGQPVEVLIPERFRGSHPDEREHYHAAPRIRAMGTGLELYGRRKDGREFPVDIMLSPIATGHGSLVLAVVRDITDRKRAEQALRLSEERLRLLVESIRDYAIFMLDDTGYITSWNTGAELIKGYRAEEIVGEHFSRLYTLEDARQGKPAEALRVAATLGRFEEEGWRVRKDGSHFWANVIITALKDGKGRVLGFSKVTRDITERRRAQEALLLEVTNVLLSNLDIRRLFSAISAGLRQLVAYDYASLTLYAADRKMLRVHVLDSSPDNAVATEDLWLPLEGSPEGSVFSTREPLSLRSLDTGQFEQGRLQQWRSMGLKSGCWLPLVSHGRPLGSLNVGSRKESAFAEGSLDLLRQLANQVAIAVDNALAFQRVAEEKEKLEEEKLYLEDELRTEYNFEDIVGESLPLKRVLKEAETVAPTNATALILGETGTGKELIARAIHNLSTRRDRTFVKLNCAAIPSGLLESELFGHERGAFTGAISQKIGRLELAHQGTLFLDEVGDIPLELQPKLLRALQEKEFERLGSNRTIPVDVRLIAATNRDLEGMVDDRQFRSDLYYRLKVFPILVPALRKRPEDIPVLVHYFVQKHAQRMNKRIETVPPEVMQALVRWHWPGNVRELENFIERAVILTRGTHLHVPLGELKASPQSDAGNVPTLEAAEREHILRVLRETKGVIAGSRGAASRLGVKRTTLNSMMKRLGISRADL